MEKTLAKTCEAPIHRHADVPFAEFASLALRAAPLPNECAGCLVSAPRGADLALRPPAVPQAALLLDRLVASPELRQEASVKLLEIAKYLSVEELGEEYEQGLCSFLSPEALELRRHTPDEDLLRPER